MNKLLITIFIITLTMMLYGCTINTSNNTNSLCQKEINKQPITKLWMINHAQQPGYTTLPVFYAIFYYQDHQGEYINLECHSGNANGENVNYIYCKGKQTTSQIVDETGNIIQTPQTYKLNFILKTSGNYTMEVPAKVLPGATFRDYYMEFIVLNLTCE